MSTDDGTDSESETTQEQKASLRGFSDLGYEAMQKAFQKTKEDELLYRNGTLDHLNYYFPIYQKVRSLIRRRDCDTISELEREEINILINQAERDYVNYFPIYQKTRSLIRRRDCDATSELEREEINTLIKQAEQNYANEKTDCKTPLSHSAIIGKEERVSDENS